MPDLFEAGEPPQRVVPGGVAGDAATTFVGHTLAEADLKATERILRPSQEGARWSHWVAASPLVPHINEQAHLDPLERASPTHLPHLAHVCHRPRLRLRVEEERVR